MYIVLISICSILISGTLNQWESLTSTLSPNKIIKYNNQLIGSTSGGLLSFHLDSQTFSRYGSSHIDCINISDMEIDSNEDLWILCSNGELLKDNSSININHLDVDSASALEIMQESIFILYAKDSVYGVIKINYNNNEATFEDYFQGFASPNSVFSEIQILNNTIYILTDEGIYYGDLDSNLKFSSNWSIVQDSQSAIDIVEFNNQIAVLYSDKIIFLDIENDSDFIVDVDLSGYIDSFSYDGLELYIIASDKIISIDTQSDITIHYQQDFNDANSLFVDESQVYLGVQDQGFWFLDSETKKCSPNTLPSTDVEAISYEDGVLYGVSRDGVFIYRDNSVSNLLSLESENSFLIDQDDCNYFQGTQFNYIPGNKISSSLEILNNKIYIPNSGILPDQENKGGVIVIDIDNYSISDIVGLSELDGLGGIYYSDIDNGYLTINQLIKDDYNNIWVVNPYAEITGHILKYYNNSNDSWGYIEAPDDISYLPQEIAFDQWNRVWVAFRNESTIDGDPYSSGGIKMVTSNGNWLTIDNLESLPGDDASVNVWSIDFGEFAGNDILWVLTSNGVQGYSVSGSRIDPIYPIDFFTNIPFIKGDKIRVDPQNNVWIITSHSGVRMIKNDISFWPSSDGITTENSDILSNVIRDIAFDYTNGRVFFGTDKGISILEVPFKDNLSSRSIGVSPNPFIIKENDFLMIDNVCSDSKIKIMTLSGLVVKSVELPYNENRFNWDGRGQDGDLLDSGVYFIVMESNQCGNGIAKLAIIK